MTTLKINARNDVHLPAKLLRQLNLGQERLVNAEIRLNTLFLVPVDVEPRYSPEELAALDQLHAEEKRKGWTILKTPADIDRALS